MILSTTPLASGCVSAVDETSAFGFNANSPAAAKIATADAATAPASPDQTASAAAGTSAAGEKADADAKPVDLAAAAKSPAGAEVAAAAKMQGAPAPTQNSLLTPASMQAPLPTGRATLAAYAAPAGDRPSADGGVALAASDAEGKPNHALFTSLFANEKARTPIPNVEKDKGKRVIVHHEAPAIPADTSALPGVDPKSLFEIGQRASADEDEIEDVKESFRVASLGGMARLAPSGLMVQRDDVQTNCFPQQLVSMVHAVEQKFGKRAVVTSGFRSPSHNRAVNGAQHSMHMQCKAADLIVPGVSKWDVANFVRSLPGRGGVGTYCYTTAVHIDVGRERDWNWECRRRRG